MSNAQYAAARNQILGASDAAARSPNLTTLNGTGAVAQNLNNNTTPDEIGAVTKNERQAIPNAKDAQ
jgi:predicted flap endonuclease-1-like 5' DNA nuclease